MSGPICGGWKEESGLSEDEFAMVCSLQDQVVAQLGSAVTHFTPLAVRKQVVAGTNFWVKIQVGEGNFIHVKIFRPLPHTGQPPQVQEVQSGKTHADPL
jgi:cystatin-A/B